MGAGIPGYGPGKKGLLLATPPDSRTFSDNFAEDGSGVFQHGFCGLYFMFLKSGISVPV